MPESGTPAATETPEKPRQPISVVVTAMPVAPKTPIWRDSARILAVAAFLLWLVTGSYTAYSTWKTQKADEIAKVDSMIAAYYSNAEKLKSMDPYREMAYVNLLRTQRRDELAQAMRIAGAIEKSVNTSTWMSLAQIEYHETNCAAAEKAWNAALGNTEDVNEYLFSLRGAS